MCTVTFIARRNGYALGMNRDEKLTRAAGIPPRLVQIGGRQVLSPSEPTGGNWIGVNDTGATFALINWYSIPAQATGNVISRGEVVHTALSIETPTAVGEMLAKLPLCRVNPFRLIGLFPSAKSVLEWRWSLKRLDRVDHPWRSNTWMSSGLDEPGAQRSRQRNFEEAQHQTSAGTADWLRRLHRSHRPERGPYSTCMHREDAATVSYTEIHVSRQHATLHYVPGAPCCSASMPAIRIQLKR